MMRLPLLLALVPLVACGPSLPDLESRISPAARNAPYPTLQPLGPLLIDTSALLPTAAETAGATLEARAATLRRRAAQLRALPL